MKAKWVWILLLVMPAACLADVETEQLDLVFEIRPVTSLEVSGPSGLPSLELGPAMPGQETEAVLRIAVLTNAGRRFRLYQTWNEPRSREGEALPGGLLRYRVSGRGSLKPETSSPEPGRSAIFESQGKPGPETVEIGYVLGAGTIPEAGDYEGTLELTLESR